MKELLNKFLKTKFNLGGGLLPLKEDRRDFQLGGLFDWFGSYTPSVKEKEIRTYSIKDQKRLNNCSFQAATVQKEVDEGVELSPRYLTAKAWQQGLCRREGYADMRAGQIVLQKFGCCEEKDCPSNSNLSWEEYVNIDFKKLDKLAEKHKTKSFWLIRSIDELKKAIDEGHIVTIGIDWYSGFNQSGGFKAPWIIQKLIGYFVGGHAMASKGFKEPQELSVVQNSYSESWGDNGDLYIDYDFLDKYIKKYGAYANLDIEYTKETAEDIIEKFNLQNVKGNERPAICLIYSGKKYIYKNPRAFVAYNGKPFTYKGLFAVVSQEELDKIPFGGFLTENSGQYAEIVKALKDPINDNFKEE